KYAHDAALALLPYVVYIKKWNDEEAAQYVTSISTNLFRYHEVEAVWHILFGDFIQRTFLLLYPICTYLTIRFLHISPPPHLLFIFFLPSLLGFALGRLIFSQMLDVFLRLDEIYDNDLPNSISISFILATIGTILVFLHYVTTIKLPLIIIVSIY